MKLCGIDFGRVWHASGAGGYFGEGYPFHRYLKPFGLDLSGATLVAKTATLRRQAGWLAYAEDGITPAEMFPDCVVVNWRAGAVLNAVGLSNPGLGALLDMGRWQRLTEPFFISVAAVNRTREVRLTEFVGMFRQLRDRSGEFRAPFGVQVNLSCPTACPIDFEEEAAEVLAVACHFLPNVPIVPKFSVETPPETVARIVGQGGCDAVCVSNSLRWGALPDEVDWRGIFGKTESPLKLYGGGGLSGAPLLRPVTDWLLRAGSIGLELPINAGGGVLCANDARALLEAGADSVFLGSIAILRPWRVRKTVKAIRAMRG